MLLLKGWIREEEWEIRYHSRRFSRPSWRRALLSTLHKILLRQHSQTQAQWQWRLCDPGRSSLQKRSSIFFFLLGPVNKTDRKHRSCFNFYRLDRQAFSPTRRFSPPYTTQSSRSSSVSRLSRNTSPLGQRFITSISSACLQMWWYIQLTCHLLRIHGDGLWYVN
jgi:hypothetical protein